MIVPATGAVGGGSGSGGAPFRVGTAPPLPRGYVESSSSSSLSLLLGPYTAMGATSYDTMHLAQAAAWVTQDYDTTEAYFYDGALVYYLLYYRTGDTQWLDRGHVLAAAHADYTAALIDGGTGDIALAARDYSTLGLAIHYLLTGYANSLAVVRAQAQTSVGTAYGPFGDARESAYHLIALVATTLLGGDVNYSAEMTLYIDAYMTYQGQDQSAGTTQPNSGWQGYSDGVSGNYYVSNYMNGLVMEALILYDRVIGDARIVPAIKTCVDWLWSTQWVPLGGGPAQSWSSTTSVTIPTPPSSKVFTVPAGLNAIGSIVGQTVYIESNVDPTNSMSGDITAYSGTTMTVNVTQIHGSGTAANWFMFIIGYPGQQSANGIGCMQYETTFVGLGGGGSLLVMPMSSNNYVCLMGIELPAFGYLYLKGQGASYKTNGDTILAALSQEPFSGVKQFNQMFRSSPHYLAWTA